MGAGHKVSASLVDEAGAVVEKVSCRKPDDGAKVTFSHLCRFSPPKLVRGTYKLIVGVKGLTGQTTEQDYAVHLE
ncbi:hypothetical protein SAMN05892877_1152 [Rhizobium subbaraonis]|uniref:Uncharacterized protein n=1 Tax=Rhizobium subbaraonis TaxID=908946 RepID=A0A285UTY0_9HYPH|nr:hypothetical protein SAMN05892877_1152 [Rhizobium subbaraonis]